MLSLDENGEPIGYPIPEYITLNIETGMTPLHDATEEQRKQFLNNWGKRAKELFDAALSRIPDLICECHPVALLSHFAFYDLMFSRGPEGKSDYQPLGQHHVELLQAILLSTHPQSFKNNILTPQQRNEITQLLKDLNEGFAHKRMGGGLDRKSHFREQIRAHTQTVRNAGSSEQIIQNLKSLFAPLDSDLIAYRGVSFTGLISICEAFLSRSGERFNDFSNNFKKIFQHSDPAKIIESYRSCFQVSKEEMAWIENELNDTSMQGEMLRRLLLSHSEIFFSKIFTETLDDLVSAYHGKASKEDIKKALDRWSITPHELQETNWEHFFLNNPIWDRPIIYFKNRDQYFWPILGLFVGFGLEMLERQFSDNEILKKKYHKRRSKYLESEVANQMAALAPGCTVFKKVEWRDKLGVGYETDILVLVDKQAFVVECKSGKLPPSARRGGSSLDQELDLLLLEPTQQGYRLEQCLLESKDPLSILSNKQPHVIDRAKIWRVTRINLLLDYLGPLACEHRFLLETGAVTHSIPPAVTMSLVDLENFFYLVPSPAVRIHYLHFRAQLESRFRVIGDEMDWLAYYLSGGRWPENEQTHINLLPSSRTLDPFFYRRDLGLPIVPPKLKRSTWWQRLIDRIESQYFEGWSEAILVLLSFPFENQNEYQAELEKRHSEISNNPDTADDDNILCAAYPLGKELLGLATIIVLSKPTHDKMLKIEQASAALLAMEPPPTMRVIITTSPRLYSTFPYVNICIACDETETP